MVKKDENVIDFEQARKKKLEEQEIEELAKDPDFIKFVQWKDKYVVAEFSIGPDGIILDEEDDDDD
tara:strand:- start:744 stop:941 length:198 start_codon:yes stop_codon:yes gene_type:complete